MRASLQCTKMSQALPFVNSVLNNMPISNEMKKELYNLTMRSSAPLVQRVSKTLFVIKCYPDSNHPLGYLHFMINLVSFCLIVMSFVF